MVRLGFALLAGVALCAAFPGHDVWVLAPVGVALLALATCGARVRTGFLLGLVTGLVFFGYSLSWAGIVVGVVPWAGLAVCQALFVALLGAATAYLQGRGPVPRIRPGSSRSRGWRRRRCATEFPTAVSPGSGWRSARPTRPSVGWPRSAARPAVTFAVALAGGLLAALVWDLGPRLSRAGRHGPAPDAGPARPGRGGRGPRRRVRRARCRPTATPSNVMAVQGNVPRAGLDFNAERRQVLDNHVTATEDAAAEVAAGDAPPSPTSWSGPRTPPTSTPPATRDAQDEILRAVDAVGAPLVVGTLLEQPAPRHLQRRAALRAGQGHHRDLRQAAPRPVRRVHPEPATSSAASATRWTWSARTSPRAPDRSSSACPRRPGARSWPDRRSASRWPTTTWSAPTSTSAPTCSWCRPTTRPSATPTSRVQQLAISRIRAMEHGRSVVHVSTVGVSALITPGRNRASAERVVHQDGPVRLAAPAERPDGRDDGGSVAGVCGRSRVRGRPAGRAPSTTDRTPPPAYRPTAHVEREPHRG